MSRFAAVPVAALDDDRLEALHIRVLTALCSFADKDGWSRVGQDRIAQRARTNESRVSSCVGDLVKWGWVRRQRLGKKKVNVYQVLMDREVDEAIPLADEETALAETASVTCPPGKSPASDFPTQQECIANTASPYEHRSITPDDDDSTCARKDFEERVLEWSDGVMSDNPDGLDSLADLLSLKTFPPCTLADVERGIDKAAHWLRRNGQKANSFTYFRAGILKARDRRLAPPTPAGDPPKKPAAFSQSDELDRMLARGRAEKARQAS